MLTGTGRSPNAFCFGGNSYLAELPVLKIEQPFGRQIRGGGSVLYDTRSTGDGGGGESYDFSLLPSSPASPSLAPRYPPPPLSARLPPQL